MEWYANGSVYVGNFLNGEKHGFGKITFITGEIYEGEFEFDDFNGRGIYVILTVDLSRDGKMVEYMMEIGLMEK